jgi:[acyl-carrier-protein] S-malonyltransferase
MLERWEDDPHYRDARDMLASNLPWDILKLARDQQRAALNRYAQPLICLHQISAWSALTQRGLSVDVVAGYSVGELAAYGVCGALAGTDVLHGAMGRARAMDGAAPSDAGMLAVRGVLLRDLDALVAHSDAQIAIRNAEDHAVLGGTRIALAKVEHEIQQRFNAHVVRLPITVPAHTVHLNAAVPIFHEALSTLRWGAFEAPVIAGVDGRSVRSKADAIDTLSRQLAEPIEWQTVLEALVELGVTTALELGPGAALSRMLHERAPHIAVRALGDFATLKGAADWAVQRSVRH